MKPHRNFVRTFYARDAAGSIRMHDDGSRMNNFVALTCDASTDLFRLRFGTYEGRARAVTTVDLSPKAAAILLAMFSHKNLAGVMQKYCDMLNAEFSEMTEKDRHIEQD